MSTDVIPAPQAGAVMLPGQYDQTGLDDVQIRPSNLVLVQPTTRNPKGAHAGQFLDSLTEEVYDEVVLVPLKVMRQRVLFPPGADLDAKPICRSDDGVVPSPYAETPQAKNCANCPHAVWLNDKPSACKAQRKFLVIVKETMLPRFVQFSGKSQPVAENFLKQVKNYVIAKQAKTGKKLALYDFYFTLSSDRVVDKKGSYYIARIKDVKEVADKNMFGPIFEEYVIRQRVIDDEEQAAVAATKAQAEVDGAVSDVIDAVPVEV